MNSAAANRAYMAKTGLTYAGQQIWTDSEIDLLTRYYPNCAVLVLLLPGRTVRSIRNKAGRLGLCRTARVWAKSEFASIKSPYVRGAPMTEILERLPNKTAKQVWAKASRERVRRPRKAPQITGLTIVDAIRRRAFDLHLSMRDLDELVGRKYYFRKPTYVNWRAVQRILPHLGGRAAVVWDAA